MSEYTLKRIQKISAILWPSFLVSAMTNAIFFVLFNPEDLLFLSGFSLVAIYSMGFLFLWVATALTAVITCYYLKPCHLTKKQN